VQRRRIAEVFKDGMVGAEVIIDGETWSVIRSIGHLRRHAAIRGLTLDEVDLNDIGRGNLETFHAAVVQTIITLPVATLIPVATEDVWAVALSWLARDQECRFAHPLIWRDSSSDSGSPALGISGALETVRALIGAMSVEEPELRRDEARIEHEKGSVLKSADRLEWHIQRERTRLCSALRLGQSGDAEGPVLLEAMRCAAHDRQFAAEVSAGDDAAPDGDPVVAWTDARDSVKEAESALAVLQARIEGANRVVAMMEGEAGPLALRELTGVSCEICDVPVSRALAEGCGISEVAARLDEVRERRRTLLERIDDEKAKLASLVRQERDLNAELSALSAEEARLRPIALAARQAHRDNKAKEVEATVLVEDVRRLDAYIDELDRNRAKYGELESALGAVRTRLSAFREQHRSVVDTLSRRFDSIVRHLLPTAEGSVRVTGTTLELSVLLGGDRTTPAIDSLKVLAFDLAVLTRSMEGANHVPAFLMHDSPREADLGPSIYDAWFELIRSLERPGQAADFQYIITTTTAPPPALRDPEYCVLKLNGSPASQRLLGKDL
jgi:hypothetical protein